MSVFSDDIKCPLNCQPGSSGGTFLKLHTMAVSWLVFSGDPIHLDWALNDLDWPVSDLVGS